MADLIAPMTIDEARTITELIRSDFTRVEERLADMHAREGWKVLGYDSWRAWATTEFPDWSQPTLYRRLAVGREVFSEMRKLPQAPAPGPQGGRPIGAQDHAPRGMASYAPRESPPSPPRASTPTVEPFVLPPATLPDEARMFMRLSGHYNYVHTDPAAVAEQAALTVQAQGIQPNAEHLRHYGEWVLAVADALEQLGQRPLRVVEGN